MPLTADKFRALALELPETIESAHMGHPDFRVGGKVFASLTWKDEEWGMVKLSPPEQHAFTRVEPEVYEPANGAWGKHGATMVRLRAAKITSVRRALASAWRNVAPKRLIEDAGDVRGDR